MTEERKIIEINETQRSKIVNVGIFQVDLAKLKPLTLADQEAMLAEPYKLDFRSPEKSPRDDVNIVWFILRKVEPQVTRELAASLSVKVSAAIVNYFTRISAEVGEVPLGLLPPPSTPLRGITAGDSGK